MEKKDWACLESVHTQFLKALIGVPTSTPDNIVLAEFGRIPIRFRCWKQILRYWNRLHETDNESLLHDALIRNAGLGVRLKWSRAVISYICQGQPLGFLQVMQKVNIAQILKSHRTSFIRDLLDPTLSRKSATYHAIRGCSNLVMQPYLSAFANLQQRRILCQFRTGSHWLRVQTGRFTNEEYAARICLQCDNQRVEDEHHSIFDCSKYDDLRTKYSDLFESSVDGLQTFFQQNNIRIAKFLTECRNSRN